MSAKLLGTQCWLRALGALTQPEQVQHWTFDRAARHRCVNQTLLSMWGYVLGLRKKIAAGNDPEFHRALLTDAMKLLRRNVEPVERQYVAEMQTTKLYRKVRELESRLRHQERRQLVEAGPR